MRRAFRIVLLTAGCALAAAAGHAQPGAAWSGPGWYQVLTADGGRGLEAGPYPTELACKKAMNASSPTRACLELREAPAGSAEAPRR